MRVGQNGSPSHGTTHFPSGTPDGFWAESGERPRGSDRRPTWRSTGQSAPPKTTADARFYAPFGPWGAASPAWVSHSHPLQDTVCRPWAVARYGSLHGPTTLPADGYANRPPGGRGASARP